MFDHNQNQLDGRPCSNMSCPRLSEPGTRVTRYTGTKHMTWQSSTSYSRSTVKLLVTLQEHSIVESKGSGFRFSYAIVRRPGTEAKVVPVNKVWQLKNGGSPGGAHTANVRVGDDKRRHCGAVGPVLRRVIGCAGCSRTMSPIHDDAGYDESPLVVHVENGDNG